MCEKREAVRMSSVCINLHPLMFPMKAVNENRFSHIKNYQETASPLTVCMYVCGMWCVVVVVCVCVMCMYVILSMTLCVCVCVYIMALAKRYMHSTTGITTINCAQ